MDNSKFAEVMALASQFELSRSVKSAGERKERGEIIENYQRCEGAKDFKKKKKKNKMAKNSKKNNR